MHVKKTPHVDGIKTHLDVNVESPKTLYVKEMKNLDAILLTVYLSMMNADLKDVKRLLKKLCAKVNSLERIAYLIKLVKVTKDVKISSITISVIKFKLMVSFASRERNNA